jgi:hypothetical protein
MTFRRRRRGLVLRLLRGRAKGAPAEVVGGCAVCGVLFAGSPEQRAGVQHLLRVHESICPGGARGGHVVTPLS